MAVYKKGKSFTGFCGSSFGLQFDVAKCRFRSVNETLSSGQSMKLRCPGIEHGYGEVIEVLDIPGRKGGYRHCQVLIALASPRLHGIEALLSSKH
jgi:hypothetical protein